MERKRSGLRDRTGNMALSTPSDVNTTSLIVKHGDTANL